MKKPFYLLFVLFLLVGQSALANNSVFVSPPLLTTLPGQEAVLTITNNTSQSITANLKTGLVERNSTAYIPKIVTPVSGISFSPNVVSIPAGQATTAIVRLTESLSVPVGNFAAVVVEQSSPNGVFSSQGQIFIPILSGNEAYTFLDADASLNGVGIKLLVPTINFTDKTNLKAIIENGTKNIIKPAGEILALQNNYNLGAMSITPQTYQDLSPTRAVEATEIFTDSRYFWQRIGFIEFKLLVNINNKQLVTSGIMLAIPWQVIVIAVIALIILLWLILHKRQKDNRAEKVAKKSNSKES